MDEKNQANSDRRRSERLPQHYVVHSQKRTVEKLSQERITDVLKDISGGGLSFISDAEYQSGDLLELEIELPGETHQVLARVARVQVFGDSKIVGVAFVEMSLEHKNVLLESLKTT